MGIFRAIPRGKPRLSTDTAYQIIVVWGDAPGPILPKVPVKCADFSGITTYKSVFMGSKAVNHGHLHG